MPGAGFRRRSAVRRPALVGAVLVLCALSLAGCGSASAPDFSGVQFGPFAGYTWAGDVRQVGAVIDVPTLSSIQKPGFAGTWIGAEGDFDPVTQRAAFFQVGVNEVSGGELAPADASHYYAFWSSTALGFHPRLLFEVKPGDPVQLSLHVAGAHLVLYARDRNTGVHRTVRVGLRAGNAFDVAAWHQEDVTDGATGTPYPYPKLSTVRFSGLTVDGHAPSVGLFATSWMSTRSAIYGPVLHGPDGFSVRVIRPSAAALRYERVAVPEDLASYVFDAQLASWSPSTPAASITAACDRYARAMTANIARLRGFRWPAAVRGDIDRLIASSREAAGLARRLAAHPKSFLAQFKRARIPALGPLIREKLHMPEFDPSAGSIASYVSAHSS
jgi:hypothetical protein